MRSWIKGLKTYSEMNRLYIGKIKSLKDNSLLYFKVIGDSYV